MASAQFNLKVEVEKEKLDALEEAHRRFAKAYEEMQAASNEVRHATTEIRYSLMVKKEED